MVGPPNQWYPLEVNIYTTRNTGIHSPKVLTTTQNNVEILINPLNLYHFIEKSAKIYRYQV